MADAIGLYLGARSLHLVHLTGQARRPKIVRIGHLALETPLTADPQSFQGVTPLLQRLLQDCRLSGPAAQVGITSEAGIVRYFQMPKLPPRDQPTAIRFEAKKYLPFKLEELLSDFQVVIAKQDPNVMRVMFYAVKKELVAQYLQVLQEAGITPRSIETSLSSLTRALRRTRQLEPGKTAALVFVDHDAASIAIVRDELVYLARNVTMLPAGAGGEAGAGEGAPPPATTAEGPASTLYTALLSEASVSVDYYRRRFASEPAVTKVLVSGEGLPASWLTELAGALELPVEPVEVGRGLPNGDQLTGNVAVAFGLALRGLESGSVPVNLLPAELRPKAKSLLPVVGLEAGAMVLLLILLYHVKSQPLQTLAAQVAALRQQPAAAALGLSSADLTVDRLQQLQRQRAAELRFLKSFVDAKVPLAEILQLLAEVTPPEIWLRHATYTNNLIAPEGGAVKGEQGLLIEGAAYHQEAPKGLEVVNQFVDTVNGRKLLSHLFGTFTLTTAQRNTLRQVDITSFELSSENKSGRERTP